MRKYVFSLFSIVFLLFVFAGFSGCGTAQDVTVEQKGITETTKVVGAVFNSIENSQAVIDKNKNAIQIASDMLPDVLNTIEVYNNRAELVKELLDLQDDEIQFLAGLSANYNLKDNDLYKNVMIIILYSVKTTLKHGNIKLSNKTIIRDNQKDFSLLNTKRDYGISPGELKNLINREIFNNKRTNNSRDRPEQLCLNK